MSKSDDKKGVSRRELLTFWRKPLEDLKPKPKPPPPPSRPALLRPPGVMHELILVNTCTHCGKCVEVCPANAILPLGLEWGAAAGTPYIDARKQPCVLCDGLQCTQVCPSGALQPTYNNKDVKMGTAVVDPARCVNFQGGQECDVCHKACPIPGAIQLLAGLTVVEELCTGCGLCEHACPTEPTSIRVVPRA